MRHLHRYGLKGVDGLLVTTNPFYEGRRDDIVALAKRYPIPVLYPWREYSVAGGFISYGTDFAEFTVKLVFMLAVI